MVLARLCELKGKVSTRRLIRSIHGIHYLRASKHRCRQRKTRLLRLLGRRWRSDRAAGSFSRVCLLRRVEEFDARGRRSRRHVTEDEAATLRLKAIRELKRLLPAAKTQTRKGKPALLRADPPRRQMKPRGSERSSLPPQKQNFHQPTRKPRRPSAGILGLRLEAKGVTHAKATLLQLQHDRKPPPRQPPLLLHPLRRAGRARRKPPVHASRNAQAARPLGRHPARSESPPPPNPRRPPRCHNAPTRQKHRVKKGVPRPPRPAPQNPRKARSRSSAHSKNGRRARKVPRPSPPEVKRPHPRSY